MINDRDRAGIGRDQTRANLTAELDRRITVRLPLLNVECPF